MGLRCICDVAVGLEQRMTRLQGLEEDRWTGGGFFRD